MISVSKPPFIDFTNRISSMDLAFQMGYALS